MRRFTLLFTALLCVFVAKAAVSITQDPKDANAVIVKAGNAGEFQSYTPTADELALLKGKSTLKLQGNFNGNDLTKFRDLQAVSATTVDFGDATFEKNSWNDLSSQTFQYWQNGKNFVMSKTETNKVTKESLWMNFNGGKPAIESIEINGTIDVEGGMFSDQTSIKTVTIGPNVGTLGTNAFKGCTSLSTLDLGGTKVIGNKAFGGCTSLTSLTIPGTVQEIVTEAFIDCDKIEKITFEEYDADNDGKSDVNMTIGELAFRQGKSIWNVYIQTEGTIKCENKAFDFATTFGHGDTGAKTATLHYPSSKVEDYCNMDHVLTYQIAQNAKDFHEWLLDHYDLASTPPKNNGWYEFVNSGPSSQEDQEPDAKVLRTYSFYYPVTKNEEGTPVTVAKLVPQGVKAYIVNGIKKNKDGNYELTLKSIFAIPANTGVLLYGTPNSKTDSEPSLPSLVMNTVAFEGYPIRRDYWDIMASSETHNMLMPTCIEFDNYGDVKKNDGHEIEVKLASRGIVVGPYDKGEDGKVKYRNFFMTKFSSTDLAKQYTANEYVGFFRAKKSWIRSGKAFLRLANTEYDSPTGGEAIILKDAAYKTEYDKDGNAIANSPLWNKLTWEDISDWGVRNLPASAKAMFFGEPEIEENEDGSATLIISAAGEQEQDGVYYTLQGVKVTNPTAGIYIKNGKKVIVK